MRRGTRMLLMTGAQDRRRDDGGGYGPDSKFRDGRGREHRTDAGHHGMDEMSWRQGSAQMGRGAWDGVHPLTRETATEWLRTIKNADGTTGPHWTMEKTEEARIQRGIDCDPLAFYVAMNMIYSDYVKVAERVGASNMDFYVYMAKAFLDDKDAQPDKLERYYQYIVRH